MILAFLPKLVCSVSQTQNVVSPPAVLECELQSPICIRTNRWSFSRMHCWIKTSTVAEIRTMIVWFRVFHLNRYVFRNTSWAKPQRRASWVKQVSLLATCPGWGCMWNKNTWLPLKVFIQFGNWDSANELCFFPPDKGEEESPEPTAEAEVSTFSKDASKTQRANC